MRILVFIFFVSSLSNVSAQLWIFDMHYVNRIDQSTGYMKDSQHVHSSVLPLIQEIPMGYYGDWKHLFGKRPVNEEIKLSHFRVYPIADISTGFSSVQHLTYTAGIGAGIDLSYNKFFFTSKLQPFLSQPKWIDQNLQSLNATPPGAMRSYDDFLYFQGELLAAYKFNKFFTAHGGYGKNFFGEGYRSLLLSDNATAQPYLKLETSFGPIKYVNLYQMWVDNTVNPIDRTLDQFKFSASHYISWNITREINLSVFETVIWQQKDGNVKRGFDFHYLNPFVFYRPVEYGIGSADNVLLGLNLSGKINKHHQIYGQVLIDEFLLSQVKSGDDWWGNKFGFQLGYKSNSFLLKNLYFQTEFNAVRPFTYSHKYSTQNYGHLNAPVAHPIGANFYELVNILSYKKKTLRLTNKIVLNSYGVDVDSINNGQNIFLSYSLREGDFGHEIGQGLRKTVLNESLILEFPLFPQINLYLFGIYNWRMEWESAGISNEHYVSLGIKSRIWNTYSDF